MPGAPALRIAAFFAARIARAAEAGTEPTAGPTAGPDAGSATEEHGSSPSAAEGRVTEVRVLAGERGRLPGVRWRFTDTGSPDVGAALAGSDVLVWVAVRTDLQAQANRRTTDRRAVLLRTGRALVLSAAATGIRHVVVVSSAEVYGALPDNPESLPDDAPLRAVADEGQVGDLLAVEAFIDESRVSYPELRFTVVRPATLVGDGVDTTLTRYFEAPRLLAVRRTSPAWQLCHVDDLASAVAKVVDVLAREERGADGRLPPALAVGCEGTLDLAQVERLSGMRRIEVGEYTAVTTAAQLHRVGVLPSPASELAYVMHRWAVASSTLRAYGWHPAYDNETCLGVLLEAIVGRHAHAGRRPDRRDAALGAASAAVALVATAALLRRARRR